MARMDRGFYAPYLRKEMYDVPGSRILFDPFFDGIGYLGKECNPGFNLQLDPEEAAAMKEEGWNVNTWQGSEMDEPVYFLKLQFAGWRPALNGRPAYPQVFESIDGKYPIELNKDTIGTLQGIRRDAIDHFDIVFHGYAADESKAFQQNPFVDEFMVHIHTQGIRGHRAYLWDQDTTDEDGSEDATFT